MKKRRKNLIRYFAHNLSIVVALVLIWRSVWYALDELDIFFFNGDHLVSVIMGVVLGLLILYLPDGDLKEIEKL